MIRSSSPAAQSEMLPVRPEDIELRDTTQVDVTWALQHSIQPSDRATH